VKKQSRRKKISASLRLRAFALKFTFKMTSEKLQPGVSIAIVTWNSAKEIAECLGPLQVLPENWEVWVADNNSADETVNIVRRNFPFVKIIANRENLGFAEACNQIAAQTDGEFLLFLNPDSRASKNELEKALNEIAGNKEIGVLGVKLLDEKGVLQKSCFKFPTVFNSLIEKSGFYRLLSENKREEYLLGDFFDHKSSREVDWFYGAFMLARRAAFEKAGGLPEDYFLFAEDLDFCYLVKRAGSKVWFFAGAAIVHKGNQSAGQMPSAWRVKRTVLSKYAFCFNRFGWLKTRLIQALDLIGNLLEAAIVKIRRPDSHFTAESKIYRALIKKALTMSRDEIFRLLRKRPEAENH
jgi:N-acetylglucosaminyl-diphospho-decaprenol L-rhamnosyltransferase